MPKNHIFSILGGGARNFWGISCEKSRFYAKKILFLPILGGGACRVGTLLFLFRIVYISFEPLELRKIFCRDDGTKGVCKLDD